MKRSLLYAFLIASTLLVFLPVTEAARVSYFNFNTSLSNSSLSVDSANASRYLNTQNGTVYSSDYYDGFYAFNGQNQSMNASTFYDFFNFQSNWTLSFWFKPISNGATQTIIQHEASSSAKDWGVDISGTTMFFRYYNTTTGSFGRGSVSGAITYDSIQHVCMPIDNTSKKITFYVNGVNMTSNNTLDPTFAKQGSSWAWWLGVDRGATEFFNGTIYEYSIYDATLSETECQRVFSMGPDGDGTIDQIANFSKTVGTIKRNWQQANTHRVWGSNHSYIDTNGDGNLDTASNYTWHREVMNNQSLGGWRGDGYLAEVTTGYQTFNTTTGITNTNDINALANVVNWTIDSGKNVTLILYKMPLIFSSNDSGCASDKTECNPYNFTMWGNHLVAFINQTACAQYQNNCKVELWNEPDLAGFYYPDNTTLRNTTVYPKYVELHNKTYPILKAAYPNLKICAPGVSSLETGSEGYNMTDHIFSQIPSKIDCVGQHVYNDAGTTLLAKTTNRTANLLYLCTRNNITNACGDIVIGEYGSSVAAQLENQTEELQRQIAETISWSMNYYPSNFTWMYYEWASTKNYTSGGRYQEVAEPLLENRFFSQYNLLSMLARYHDGGSTAVNSTTQLGSVSILSSYNGSRKYITLTNSNNVTFNESIRPVGLANPYRLKDVNTGKLFNYSTSTSMFDPVPLNYNNVSTLELQTNISLSASYPVTPYNIAEPNNQTFDVNFTGDTNVSVTWLVNSSNQTSCYGLESCTFIGNYSRAGNWTINVTVVGLYNNISYQWILQVNQTTSPISFASTSPTSPVTVTGGQSQNFSYTLTNLESLATVSTWYIAGVNQTVCYNATSCNIATTATNLGLFSVQVSVSSSLNNITNSWVMNVVEPTDVCGISGISGVVGYIPVLAIVFMLVGIILGITGIADLTTVLSIVALGFVLVIIPVIYGCI